MHGLGIHYKYALTNVKLIGVSTIAKNTCGKYLNLKLTFSLSLGFTHAKRSLILKKVYCIRL